MIQNLHPKIACKLIEQATRAHNLLPGKTQAAASAEELCELSVLLLQYSLGKDREDQVKHIRLEIIDCYIMLQQMTDLFFDGDASLFDAAMNVKLSKLKCFLDKVELAKT